MRARTSSPPSWSIALFFSRQIDRGSTRTHRCSAIITYWCSLRPLLIVASTCSDQSAARGFHTTEPGGRMEEMACSGTWQGSYTGLPRRWKLRHCEFNQRERYACRRRQACETFSEISNCAFRLPGTQATSAHRRTSCHWARKDTFGLKSTMC